MAEQEKPWIGVDLDGTLARDYGWKGVNHIGSPIKRMVDRIRRWHNAGKRVKIFTARVSDPAAEAPIKAWLKKHRLPDLEITNVKDNFMVQLWDDRAVPMRHNKGTRRDDERIAESVVRVLLDDYRDEEGGFYGGEYRPFASFVPYWMSPDAELVRVANHLTWARNNVLMMTPFHDPKVEGVMPEMRRRGWLRVVVEGKTLLANPAHASRRQLESLREYADENNLTIVDDVTQRPYFDPNEA
jgi:hypothetical protein